MKPAELIASVEKKAPSGCYHIKVLMGQVRTRVRAPNGKVGLISSSEIEYIAPAMVIGHITPIDGEWNGMSLEKDDKNEYVDSSEFYEAIYRNGVRRVDYLCHP